MFRTLHICFTCIRYLQTYKHTLRIMYIYIALYVHKALNMFVLLAYVTYVTYICNTLRS